MPYLPNVNAYLHQSSLLLQAYPDTTRITTKYSLPRKRKSEPAAVASTEKPDASSDGTESRKPVREQQSPAATLTFKTFETIAGICLKYQTNKSAEVGRLMTGLGRLASGQIIEEPSLPAAGGEYKAPEAEQMMDIETPTPKVEKVSETASGGKARKKKGKK